ncbi:DUF2953 domain-containing protein [[Clostridium] colinum]|uniref:DUF2953 domain-containing protein n=1 Tax=[Clostridium] colinum TaxID=36835 RepID=UPI002025B35C|nr:DUF2953 domain-containing protein [[Clostridium] colinum]
MKILAILLGLLKIIGIILALILIIFFIIIFSNIKLKVIFKKNEEISYFIKVSYIFGLFTYILDNNKNINCFKILGINLQKFKKNKDIDNNEKEEVYICSVDKEEEINKNIYKKTEKNKDINEKVNNKNLKQEENTKKQHNKNKKFLKFKNILLYPNKKEVINIVYLLLKRLIKAIKFKIIKINIDYGLYEPFKTGNTCGIISSIIPFLPKKYIKNISIMPDFEKEVFLADVEIKCKTALIKILLPIIIFISKKPIRKIIFSKGE